MRYDAKELTRLALATPDKFVKEGRLWMKNRQDGLFKNTEGFVERWCRLRGNLFFYFKGKFANNEVAGCLFMERYTVQLEIEDETLFSFSLIFEGEDRPYTFAAENEKERESWIQNLHVASYECMKMQVDSLTEQIQRKTGCDPFNQVIGEIEDLENTWTKSRSVSLSEDNAMEIGISCSGLPIDNADQPPNPVVIVSTIIPLEQAWEPVSQTEIVDKSTDPHFLTTIGLGNQSGIDENMRVKLAVYNVKERMTNTMTEIGQVIFTMSDILRASSNKLQLRLNSRDYGVAGIITVMSWPNNVNASSKCEDVFYPSMSHPKPKRLDMLRSFCDNVFIKSFRFDTLHGHKLAVYEYMAESKLCFHLPLLLLKIWIDRERKLIDNLQDLGELNINWAIAKKTMHEKYTENMKFYSQRVDFLHNFAGPNFKPSTQKAEKDLEFIPVNLHLQRMTVENEQTQESGGYDTVTSGAFTAIPHKFRDGGLHRMLKKLYETLQSNSPNSAQAKMYKASELLESVSNTKMAACHFCDDLADAVRDLNPSHEKITKSLSRLKVKVQLLIEICEDPLIADSYKAYIQSRPSYRKSPSNNQSSPSSSPGTKVKIANVEPWELSFINTDAALVCIQTLVDDFLSHDSATDQSVKPSDVSHAIIKLKSFLSLLVKRAVNALTFLSLMDHKDNIPFLHAIRYRRDVIFSHSVTTLATGFMSKIRTSIHNEVFLHQLHSIGLLAEFESLLTCIGDELGMVRDMIVATSDLRHVTFKLIQSISDHHILPEIIPNKFSVTILMPVPSVMFQLLPRELQEGHLIKVIPVLFNIGINEQVIFAERLGDMALQEDINARGAQDLADYYASFKERLHDPDSGKHSAESVETLTRQLLYQVSAKRSKNVEILHIASEICRKLNGIRFISCKSGKDRTAMSVTLEQVHLLQRNHSLASHIFNHALDCFRSEGVRRENTLKNVGVRRYAFNSLQLPHFPKIYRPPNGTYGNVQS